MRIGKLTMRSLHRDIGFLVVGITLMYAFSGMLLVFRDTDFLKSEKLVEKILEPQLPTAEIAKKIKKRRLEEVRNTPDTLYFKEGWYHKSTGKVFYAKKSLPLVLEKMTELHKSPSKKPTFIVSLVYGTLLFFLAISSFWMFPLRAKLFKRGAIMSVFGILFVAVLLIL